MSLTDIQPLPKSIDAIISLLIFSKLQILTNCQPFHVPSSVLSSSPHTNEGAVEYEANGPFEAVEQRELLVWGQSLNSKE